MKERFTKEPVLAAPDLDKKLRVEVDALDYAMGRVVVATTHRNGTCSLLTSAELSVGYLVVGITRELDKEPSLHCSSIYITYRWSMLKKLQNS